MDFSLKVQKFTNQRELVLKLLTSNRERHTTEKKATRKDNESDNPRPGSLASVMIGEIYQNMIKIFMITVISSEVYPEVV